MTKEQAQVRNWDIAQLRGILSRVAKLLPDDIVGEDTDKQDELNNLAMYFYKKIEDAKVKRFTCEKCNPIHGKLTKNKKVWRCDYCKAYCVPLYNVKKD